MNLEKALLVASITIQSLCNITLFVSSAILFRRTKQKGFAIITAGFGLWILEQSVYFFASSDFIVSYMKHIAYLGKLGLVLISLGFVVLVRRDVQQQ